MSAESIIHWIEKKERNNPRRLSIQKYFRRRKMIETICAFVCDTKRYEHATTWNHDEIVGDLVCPFQEKTKWRLYRKLHYETQRHNNSTSLLCACVDVCILLFVPTVVHEEQREIRSHTITHFFFVLCIDAVSMMMSRHGTRTKKNVAHLSATRCYCGISR